MWDAITTSVKSYWSYYVQLLYSEWNSMNPVKYGMLLIVVFVVGFLFLKSGLKKT